MRDFLDTVRRQIVVFDGGMGATLEQFDLTQEDYGGLQGKCHEALVLNRPDVIEGVHTSMVDAGAIVVETDTFQASRLKLDEWGLGEHTLEINTKAAEIARKAVGEDRFVAGSIGPTGYLPASDDPTLGTDPLRRARRGLHRAGDGPAPGRRRPDHHRDGAGHPRGQGRRLRHARGVQADRQAGADPVLGVAPPAGRQDAARHRHPGGADDPHRARGRRDRPELLDRPGGHARRDPVPGRALARAAPLHPERGHPGPGPRGRDDLPRAAGAARERAPGVRRALRRRHRRRLLRHDARPHRGDRRAGRRQGAAAAAGAGRAAARVDDDRHPARPGAAPDARRRAGQLAGLAQGEGAAARRRLRRPRRGRRGPGRGRRSRARPVRRADRAPGRGRADAAGGEARLAHPAGADPDRLDRARRDPHRARADPRPRDRELGEPRGGARQARRRGAAREGSTAPP